MAITDGASLVPGPLLDTECVNLFGPQDPLR